MQAKKMILKTDKNGHLISQLQFPPNTSMEAIFLLLEDKKQVETKNNPSKRIFGKGKISGDIMSPVVPHDDWDILQ
jgi:hypothetical protein